MTNGLAGKVIHVSREPDKFYLSNVSTLQQMYLLVLAIQLRLLKTDQNVAIYSPSGKI